MVEWYSHEDRVEAHTMPLLRSLVNIKQEISEQKWVEARQWAGGRTSKTKYQRSESQRPEGTVAGSCKRLSSCFYQLQTGHCNTGQYLNWTKNRSTPQWWWCWNTIQTREYLFKVSGEEGLTDDPVGGGRKEARRQDDRWKIGNPLADERCSL